MAPDRPSVFCDLALAARIERAEAGLIAAASEAAARRAPDAGGFMIGVGGGVASFAEDESPFNKVAGLGFGGVPSAEALDEIEQAFAARGAGVQVELAHLAAPAIGGLLSARGYRLASFENVLGRRLASDAEPMGAPGVEVRRSAGDDDLQRWLDVVVEGVAHPDVEGVPAHEEFVSDAVERAERDLLAAGVTRYLALWDGVAAGAAGLRVTDGLAQLTGAATVPAYRRRGVHAALLSARLADAVAADCDLAVITCPPASRSQQNAQRHGFELLYARAVLVKPAPGRATAGSC